MAKEWEAIWHNKRVLAILLLVPILYLLLFGSLYRENKVKEIATLVLDEDQSVLSQQIIQAFDASETFAVVGTAASEEDLVQSLRRGEAAVGVIVPRNPSQVLTLIDGSNMIVSNAALRAANEIVQTFSLQLAVQKWKGNPVAISSEFRILFNPGFSYSTFLLLGLLGAVVQQVVFLGIAFSVTREALSGPPLAVLCGKAVPYFLLGLFDALLTVRVANAVYGIPFLGRPSHYLLLSVAFILALVGIGMFFSLMAKDALQAVQLTMLIAVPSFLLSGFTWPFSAMPDWVATLGHFLPLTYFLHGLREVAIKGNGWEMVAGDVHVLLKMALVTFVLAYVLARVKVKRQSRKMRSSETASVATEPAPGNPAVS